ncbi:WD repeat-containing protein 43 [Planoprotostelium fungivorum]|uniref:WD repeat-containing protein 43 n=1 Tax=Planoprotostelium fungivorum TaxID=1890364 RepID=A0A2P6NNX4_9EUKA|nr:WD repeat-containing protein 43 [Planoprotostelium fungivorum]PRP85663.1 WD repeat-containing protein 43 [Planoprotostelium fungivorum]
MRIAAFDEKREFFAAIGADNRLALWNTLAGQLKKEFVEESQLADTYTCMAWAPAANKDVKENAIKGLRQSILAIGTASGGIIVWDLIQGKVVHYLEGHRAQVNHIIFSKNGEFLYSCSDDQFVIQWSLSTQAPVHKFKKDTQPLSRLALNHDETVLAVAGTVIKLIDLASKRIMKKLGGHSKSVTALHFSAEGEMLFSAANDRYVLVWDTAADSAVSTQLYSFISNTSTSDLDIVSVGNQTYHILGYTSSGPEVHVWECKYDVDPNAKRKPLAAACTIKQGAVHAAFSQDEYITLVKEAAGKFTFSTLKYKEKEDILKEVHEVAPKKVREKIEKEKQVKLVLPSDGKVAKSSFGKTEKSKTIQEELDAIQLKLQQETETTPDVIVADSLQNILQQALQKNDVNMINQILTVTKIHVIISTIMKLPNSCISELLLILVQKLEQGNNPHLLVWLRAIFQHHASFLISNGKLASQLEGLYVALSARISSYKKLCKLHGKLDVLLSQSKKFTNSIENGPTYEESSGDEDDDEEEDEEEETNGGVSEEEDSDHEESGVADEGEEMEDF